MTARPEEQTETMDDPVAKDLAGELEGTSYRLVRPLAKGGMGEVYVVEHVELGTEAVMKIIHRELAEQAQLSTRLRIEARTLKRLEHEHLVRVTDFGWTRARRAFLVTELLIGESLGERLRRESVMPVSEALALVEQLLEGLEVVHAADIVHRDLKPDNLFLAAPKRHGDPISLKILDFGIAKVLSSEGQGALGHVKTATGMMVGTPTYIAPEQALGELVDQRADIYAVGCILYRALTGRPPFVKASQLDVLSAHIIEAPVPPSRWAREDIGHDVDQLVLVAMQKKPELRFQTTHAMREAVRALRPARSIELPPPSAHVASLTGATPESMGSPGARLALPAANALAPSPSLGMGPRSGDDPTLIELSPPSFEASPLAAEPAPKSSWRAAFIGLGLGFLVLFLFTLGLVLGRTGR